jgi:hypothetical protein
LTPALGYGKKEAMIRLDNNLTGWWWRRSDRRLPLG